MELERERKPPVFKDKPDWGLNALYNERQYVVGGLRTKLFLPFDISMPFPGWVLHYSEGEREICTMALDKQVVLVGRQAVCNLRFEGANVSRQHLALVFRSSVPYVIDLNSKNGVRLNGDQILTARFIELFDHDTMEFADCLIQIRRIEI